MTPQGEDHPPKTMSIRRARAVQHGEEEYRPTQLPFVRMGVYDDDDGMEWAALGQDAVEKPVALNAWKLGPKAIPYSSTWEITTSVSWDQVREVTPMIQHVDLSGASTEIEWIERVLGDQLFQSFWKLQYKTFFKNNVAFPHPDLIKVGANFVVTDIDLILSITIDSAVTWMSWWEVQYKNCVNTGVPEETIKTRLPYFVAYVLNLCVPVIQMRQSSALKNLAQAQTDLAALQQHQGLQNHVFTQLGGKGADPEVLRRKTDAVVHAIEQANRNTFKAPGNLLDLEANFIRNEVEVIVITNNNLYLFDKVTPAITNAFATSRAGWVDIQKAE